MGARQRGAKVTRPVAQADLDRLAASSVAPAVRERPTWKLHQDEIRGLAQYSVRAPTSGVDDERDRSTQQMSPTHFQLLLQVQQQGLAIAPDDIVRMGEAEAAAMLQLATGSMEIRVADLARPGSAARLPIARRSWLGATALVVGVVALAAIALVLAMTR